MSNRLSALLAQSTAEKGSFEVDNKRATVDNGAGKKDLRKKCAYQTEKDEKREPAAKDTIFGKEERKTNKELRRLKRIDMKNANEDHKRLEAQPDHERNLRR